MSIRKRTWTKGDGTEQTAWCVDYRDPHGKRRHKTFATKGAARKWWEAEAAPTVHAGTHTADSASITVKEATENWIEAARQGRGDHGPAEVSTLRQYRYHADLYIVPKLGKEKLSRLTKARVMAFRDDLLATVSRSLARKVLASLKGILSEAQDRGHVAVNAAARVKIGTGKRDRQEVTIPDIAEIKAILGKLDEFASQDDAKKAKAWRRWRAFLATAIHTGFRASELRGLPWEAVGGSKVSVYQRADENGTIGKPKSRSSYRTVSIPADLVKLLRAWKVECPKGALVFPNGAGNPESLGNIYNRAWKPVQLAAEIADPKGDGQGNAVRDEEGRPIFEPRYNFHTLRHFHASLLIHDGANPKEVQAEMGHSSIQVTYDLYGHLFQDEEADRRRRERSDRLAGLLA